MEDGQKRERDAYKRERVRAKAQVEHVSKTEAKRYKQRRGAAFSLVVQALTDRHHRVGCETQPSTAAWYGPQATLKRGRIDDRSIPMAATGSQGLLGCTGPFPSSSLSSVTSPSAPHTYSRPSRLSPAE